MAWMQLGVHRLCRICRTAAVLVSINATFGYCTNSMAFKMYNSYYNWYEIASKYKGAKDWQKNEIVITRKLSNEIVKSRGDEGKG
jgi:hypothetical protein